MKLSNRTIQILKNFSTINPSMVFTTNGVINSRDISSTIIGIAKIEEIFDKEWCIYDLSKFLSSLSLFSEPNLEFSDHYVTIREGDTHVLNYVFCDKKVIPKLVTENELSKIDAFKSSTQFELPMKLFKDVLKASSILKLPNISFISENGKIYIKGTNLSMKESSDNYSVYICDTDSKFNLNFNIENFKLLDEEKYVVDILEVGVIRFSSNDVKYIVMPLNK